MWGFASKKWIPWSTGISWEGWNNSQLVPANWGQEILGKKLMGACICNNCEKSFVIEIKRIWKAKKRYNLDWHWGMLRMINESPVFANAMKKHWIGDLFILFLWKNWIGWLDYVVKGLLEYVNIERKNGRVLEKMWKLGGCSGDVIFLCRVFYGEFYGSD
jgi:hypothetical protein